LLTLSLKIPGDLALINPLSRSRLDLKINFLHN
jgi:hypothetical protein